MSFQIYHTVERFGEKKLTDYPSFEIVMFFESTGKISCVRGDQHTFWKCVPFSTKVSNRIIMEEKSDRGNLWNVEFTKDSQQRVIEALVRDSNTPRSIFRYSYLVNSNKISSVKGYNSDGELCSEVIYSYNKGRLSELHFKEFTKTIKGTYLVAESKKIITYDVHGNYKKIDIQNWRHTRNAGNHLVYTFENLYDTKGRISISKVGYCFSTNFGTRRGGSTQYHTRKFFYDNHGNWIKIETDQGSVAIRRFEYKT